MSHGTKQLECINESKFSTSELQHNFMILKECQWVRWYVLPHVQSWRMCKTGACFRRNIHPYRYFQFSL